MAVPAFSNPLYCEDKANNDSTLKKSTQMDNYNRPLPPPESQSAIIGQSKSQTNWSAIDSDGDIFISKLPLKRHSNKEESEVLIEEEQNKKLELADASIEAENGQSIRKFMAILEDTPHHSKKRRLFPTEKSREIATESGKRFTAITEHVKSELLTDKQPQSTQDQPLSPSSQNDSFLEAAELIDSRPQRTTNYSPSAWANLNQLNMTPGSDITRDEDTLLKQLNIVKEIHNVGFVKPKSKNESFSYSSNPTNPVRSPSSDFSKHDCGRRASRSLELRQLDLSRREESQLPDTNLQVPGTVAQLSTKLRPGTYERSSNQSNSVIIGDLSPGKKEELSKTPNGVLDANMSDSQMDSLLDFVQSHVKSQTGRPKLLVREDLKSHRHRSDPNAIHPASSVAAERFRTQNRHVSGNRQDQSVISNKAELQDREDVLRSITQSHHHAENVERINAQLQDREKLLSRNAAQTVSTVSGQNEQFEKGTPKYAKNNHSAVPGLETFARSLQRGETEAKFRTPQQELIKKLSTTKKKELDPTQLSLPLHFCHYPLEKQNVIIMHERQKERKKDLEIIMCTFRDIARLTCLGRLSEKEKSEVQEVRKFVGIVVEQTLPGKIMRGRIHRIRDNMRRRYSGYEEPSQTEIEEHFIALLGDHRRVRVIKEIDDLDEKINFLGLERTNFTLKRSHKRGGYKDNIKRLDKDRFNRSVSPFNDDNSEGEFKISKQVKPIQNCDREGRNRKRCLNKDLKQAPVPKSNNEKISQLKLQLAKFDGLERPLESGGFLQSSTASSTYHENGTENSDAASFESEEDDGADFAFGADWNKHNGKNLPGEYENPISTERRASADPESSEQLYQRQITSHDIHIPTNVDNLRRSNGQMFSMDLYQRMSQRQVELNANSLDDSENDLLNGANMSTNEESESDYDSDSSTEIETHSEQAQQIFKYIVTGQFIGIELYKDGDEYIFKNYYDLEKANKKVASVMQDFLKQYLPRDATWSGCWKLQHSSNEGMDEQLVTMYADESVQARVWIERKVIKLNAKKKRHKRVQQIMRNFSRALWYVEWEKSATMVSPSAETESVIDETVRPAVADRPTQTEDVNMEKSFFPTSSLPGESTSASTNESKPQTSIERPRIDEIDLFSTPVLANAHARQIYLDWYNSFYIGLENERVRNEKQDEIEQQLQRLGDWGLWAVDDELVKVIKTLSGEEKKAPVADGKSIRERMQIWVRCRGVKGPFN